MTKNYLCDTLPEPQNLASASSPSPNLMHNLHLAPDSAADATSAFDVPTQEEIMNNQAEPLQASVVTMGDVDMSADLASLSPPRERKLCVRHLRMADEGTFSRVQKSLDALPVQDRLAVNTIWSTFSSSSHQRRATILQGILTMCCFSQLSYLTEQLNALIRLDPFSVFPKEVSLKVLGYLDAISLCRAAQVSKAWLMLADDDILWHSICEQHIGHTCRKCGWGLPILDSKRKTLRSQTPTPSQASRSSASPKRDLEDSDASVRPGKKYKSSGSAPDPAFAAAALVETLIPESTSVTSTRPWKSVYCERLAIERNWRRGRCAVRTLKGHNDGIMCMQLSETFTHPSFPILITGSYDRTVRVWNLDNGEEVSVLHGHGRAVRALQFDEAKLITGSMDRTLKVWNWRTGTCIRTLEGHAEGVVCLNFDSNVLASGSVDTTIKIWNFRTGGCFTLRGHHDWVNSLQIWDGMHDQNNLKPHSDVSPSLNTNSDIDPGKMLFSASDDGTIKLWDLVNRCCVRTFGGHVGQVQSIKLAFDGCDQVKHQQLLINDNPKSDGKQTSQCSSRQFHNSSKSKISKMVPLPDDRPSELRPVLLSGSLDNTIKVWDIAEGRNIETLFGHIEGVWAVAVDSLRLVSGSHDRTIKIWSRKDNTCTATLVGHRAAVTCISLGDDKIVSGSDDGDVRIWSFSPTPSAGPNLV